MFQSWPVGSFSHNWPDNFRFEILQKSWIMTNYLWQKPVDKKLQITRNFFPWKEMQKQKKGNTDQNRHFYAFIFGPQLKQTGHSYNKSLHECNLNQKIAIFWFFKDKHMLSRFPVRELIYSSIWRFYTFESFDTGDMGTRPWFWSNFWSDGMDNLIFDIISLWFWQLGKMW